MPIRFRFLPLTLAVLGALSLPARAQETPGAADLTTPPSLRQGGAPEARVPDPKPAKKKKMRAGKAPGATKVEGALESDAAAPEDPSAEKAPGFTPNVTNSGAGFGFKF